MRCWILCSALSLTACASSHPGSGDGGLDASGDVIDAPGEGGVLDAPHPCGERAGHPICGAGCSAGCPGGEDVMACVVDVGVCVYIGGCQFREREGFLPPSAAFCQGGSACAARWVGSDFRGTCYTVELCQEEALDCIYYDQTPVVDGPPVDSVACPSATEVAFCGPSCDFARCALPEGAGPFDRASCIGVNEERAIGVCAYQTTSVCTPERSNDLYCMLHFGEPCACLADRGTSPPEWGWQTRRSDCLAYRALFPDDFHCLDATWNEIE